VMRIQPENLFFQLAVRIHFHLHYFTASKISDFALIVEERLQNED